MPARSAQACPKQRCTPSRRDARTRRHQTVRWTGPVGLSPREREDRRTRPWSLLPWPRADAVRAQRDAAGPRRRLRTPPAPRPMPPRRSGSWTFCVRDEQRSHELTRPARAARHGTEAPDHSERARAPWLARSLEA